MRQTTVLDSEYRVVQINSFERVSKEIDRVSQFSVVQIVMLRILRVRRFGSAIVILSCAV